MTNVLPFKRKTEFVVRIVLEGGSIFHVTYFAPSSMELVLFCLDKYRNAKRITVISQENK